ncbi:MAG: phosphoserine phosphatase SerB [Pseudomonadota bacterium]
MTDDMLTALRTRAGAASTDCNLVPTDGRRKKLLVADMESTIIAQECLDELAADVGIGDAVKTITARAMNGELDFEDALRERVVMLEGVSVAALDALYEDRVTLMPGAPELVATMAAQGATTALVSGGFTYFTARVAERLGFDTHRANTLAIEADKLTGHVVPPILGRAAKLEALNALCAEHGLTGRDAVCVGDGANDLDMINAANAQGGMGIAFHAKPVVAAEARYRLDHADLRGLLDLQGFRDAEISAS